MNVLLVFSAASFQIEGSLGQNLELELMQKGKPFERIEIEPGEHVLAPGVYRFDDRVGVNKVNGSVGESEILSVPDEKKPWPDPPLVTKMTSLLGVTERDLVDFLGGANVATDLG